MKRPLPSEILTYTDHMTAKGQLLAPRDNGSRAACYNICPGETARCLIGGRRKSAREAWLQEIIKPSSDRVIPACPHFGICGGCALQQLNYPAQVALKAQPIITALRELAGSDFTLLPPCQAPSPHHYRSKIELSFIGDSLGFNKRGRFDEAVDISDCLIGPPITGAVVTLVRAWQKRHAYEGWAPRSGSGFLRYLVIRQSTATQQFLVALVTSTPPDFSLDDTNSPLYELANELRQLGAEGVIHALHTQPSGAVMAEETRILAGRDLIVERINNLEFELSWRSFFQSNPPGYANMLRIVNEWLGNCGRLLDLYCGVGSIGLSLQGELTGVECVPEAIENAKANAEKAGIKANFVCAASEDWPDLGCDTLILDPPRSGCHPKLTKRLPHEGPKRILYISCNPKRFLEEYAVLKSAYRIERVQMFDFFPQTPHIECVVLMSRKDGNAS